ncbi:MAG TPA: rod shape-determining protein MreC [Armatimonadota bacterium]|jgi:rod shape-determining protein MreC|nr:rod shape-determining protein MreC [Armatimonadota bacterium]HOP79048.1 rod shape-determining protein MreC [Armatimonadota bacterium]HPP75399.1 rod shape-determining protein MreC [Armatimonadota bacterium]
MLHMLRNGKIAVLIALIAFGTLTGVAHNSTLDEDKVFSVKPFIPEDCVRVVMKPFQNTLSCVSGVFDGISKSLRSRKLLQKENRQLREEVKRLNMEVAQLREDAAEAKRLRSALALKQQSPDKLLAVRIISRNPSEWFVTATIDRGSKSGIQPGQPVITHRGMLGQVFEVSPTSALIRGINDNHSGVGAMVQRSRAMGMCQGMGGESGLLHLTYLAKDADVKPGDIVVTSGQGGIAPKGLPLGRVVKVQVESGGFMKSAKVKPSVRFESVEEAFVVLRKVE